MFVNRHVSPACRILPFQDEMISVSKSFSSSSAVVYQDLLEVVQEHTIFKRPSMVLLSVSVRSFVSTPSCNRLRPSFVAIVDSVYSFPVIVLPLFMSMALSLSSPLDNVQKFSKDVESYSNLICAFLRRYQTLTVSPSECFKQIRHLSCSDCSAKIVQLDVAHFF